MSEASEMTDEQIQEQLEALQRERQRREEAAAREEEKAALADQINDLLVRYKMLCVDGDSTEWVQPVSALDAYPRGSVRTHKGQEWESTVVANIWEPGVSGWRLTPERDETGTEIIHTPEEHPDSWVRVGTGADPDDPGDEDDGPETDEGDDEENDD